MQSLIVSSVLSKCTEKIGQLQKVGQIFVPWRSLFIGT